MVQRPDAASPDDAGTDDAGDQTPVPEPKSAYLRFKGGERIAADLATALQLPREELCRELGNFDCFQTVHQVVLGGVEPYELRIDEASPDPAVATPLAVERVAWSACERAVARDLEGPAVLFTDVLDPDAPDDPDGGREATAVKLVERLLGRRAEAGEAVRLAGFQPDASAQDWAVGACFVVATSAEALFY